MSRLFYRVIVLRLLGGRRLGRPHRVEGVTLVRQLREDEETVQKTVWSLGEANGDHYCKSSGLCASAPLFYDTKLKLLWTNYIRLALSGPASHVLIAQETGRAFANEKEKTNFVSHRELEPWRDLPNLFAPTPFA